MISLQPYNSFQVKSHCDSLTQITSVQQLEELCRLTNDDVHILGGGSNSLFVNNPGAVWLIDIKHVEVVKEREEYQLVRFGAGEEWHDVVKYAVANNLGGIENLALIPGKTGAGPIQNIGAYGVELKDVLQSVSVVERSTGNRLEYHASACAFGYRNSKFKQEWKGKYIIDSIVLKLIKADYHTVNISYGAIAKQIGKQDAVTIQDVFDAVVSIRSSKLPDPKVIGNGGSFFKNPIVNLDVYHQLISAFPEAPSYQVDEEHKKIPAGWLIDQAGWKGKTIGNVGCYEKQALVIINTGDATGQEVLEFSAMVQESVADTFGILLEREINVV